MRAITAILTVLLPAVAATALPPFRPDLVAAPGRASELVDVRVEADADGVAAGRTFHVAVRMKIAPKWHVYWRNSGDSGAATEIVVHAPDGFTVGPVQYPRPEAFDEPEGRTYGYSREAVLFVPVTAPATLDAPSFGFDVDVYYLVCRERCLIGSERRTLQMEATTAAAPARRELDRYRRRIPKPLDALDGAAARVEPGPDGAALVITGPASGKREAAFFPFDTPGVLPDAAHVVVVDGRFRITVPFTTEPRNALGAPLRVGGVIGLGPGPDGPAYEITIPIGKRPPPESER
jgi:thiol:disulfide interchange protein DsbD